jgi:hypothetical protein
MTMTEHGEPVVVLDLDQVETLHHLLGTVEDWLLHCSDDALDDLAGFLAGLSCTSHATPQQLAANLVNDLGSHGVALSAALRETALRETAPRETAPRGAGIASGPTA